MAKNRIGLFLFLVVTIAAVLVVIGPHRPMPVPAETTPTPVRSYGWEHRPDDVAEIAAQFPRFSRVEAFLDTPAIPDQVFLWEASNKVLGKQLPAMDQKDVGSCVAFGAAAVLHALQLCQIANTGEGEFRPLSTETIYGGSRVQVGGGRIRGDGSVGAWALQYCQRWGITARDKYAKHDLREYSVATCREFGRLGVPAYLLEEAKLRPVRGGAKISTLEELRKALANGYPVTVASGQGFNDVRDSEGFLRPQGEWNHQMAILGYKSGARPGFLIVNSWGPDWVKGPKGPGDPPEGSFWADAHVVAKMLSWGDSWAYSDVEGFPSRKLKWFFQGPVYQPDFSPKGVKPCFALAW